MTLVVRAEAPADARAIFAVHAAAFPTVAEANLVDALRRRNELTASLVAVLDGATVGHVAFSGLSLSSGVGLAPVAVLPRVHRRGVATGLIVAGLAASREHGFCVVLGAPRFYARFGFEPAARHGLRDEYGGGDAFQVLALREGGIPRGAGLVRYASAFASLP